MTRSQVALFALILVVVALAGACSGTPSNPGPDPDTTTAGAPPTEPVRIACALRSELECLEASDCTLQGGEGTYSCVEPAGPCEQGFVQRTGTQQECEAAGCTFVPANCYCPPDLTCFCGGGPPAQCVATAG